MSKQTKVLYFSILLFIIIYIYPLSYKDNIQNSIFLFFTFFIPALFPTAFLILLVLKTRVLQDLNKKRPKLVSFLLTIILAIGGTPILLALVNELKIDDKLKKSLWRYITPSFSYCLYLLKASLNNNAYIFAIILILPSILLQIFKPISFNFIEQTKEEKTWEMIISSADSVIKSLYFLMLTILIISLLYPLIDLILPLSVSPFIMGILEYTQGSRLVAVKIDFISCMLCFFVLEFNGLASFMAVKNKCKDIFIPRFIFNRFIVSLLLLVPLGFLFKAFYN